MIERRASTDLRRRLLRLTVLVLVLLLFTGLPSTFAATPAPHLNGAGLVIKHGDGRVLYLYVQFSEPQITGEQLLERAGVQLDITPYAGVGSGVCMIDHEGCPSSNCFCKSFAVPSVFWRYHSLNADGKWAFRATGPSQRIVHDGDVDGWSWSSEDGDLPVTSIDAIAKLNGIARSPASDIRTATPASSPKATSTVVTPIATVAPRATVTATPRVAGVAVSESGDVTPIDPATAEQGDSRRTYLWFGAGVAALLVIAGIVVVRQRSGSTR